MFSTIFQIVVLFALLWTTITNARINPHSLHLNELYTKTTNHGMLVHSQTGSQFVEILRENSNGDISLNGKLDFLKKYLSKISFCIFINQFLYMI